MPLNCSCLALIFEQAFYYHGHLRWNYGWATPNYAGAFLATIEPVIWISAKLAYDKSRAKTINGFQFLAELVFWFLLARTYSRGSIVAAFCARAAWQASQGELTAVKTWACYLVAPLACILSNGFGGRIYNSVATVDPSVEHRLELWTAGLRMSAASPWTGWGSGKSGIVYMNWYESPGHNEAVSTMVNSYLSLAVEHGLPVFCLLIFVSAGLVCDGLSASKSAGNAGRAAQAMALGAATSACVAWLATNIFTTLWIVPSLWIVPGAAVCIIAGCRDAWQALCPKIILQCAYLSLGAGLFLLSTGMALDWYSPVRVRHNKGNTVTLESRDHSPENGEMPAVDLWPDPIVLGEFPGRLLRAWMQQTGGPKILNVYTQSGSINDEEKITRDKRILVLVGRQVSHLPFIQSSPADRIILVHPLQLEKADLGPLRGLKTVVVIPAIDQAGTNNAIKTEACALGSEVMFSPGTGIDLQAAWPEAMKAAIATR